MIKYIGMKTRIAILMAFFFLFSCSKREYNVNQLAKALVKHSYYSLTEQEAQKLAESVTEIKKVDKKFKLIDLDKEIIKKGKSSKVKKEFPFLIKKYLDKYYIVKVFNYSFAYQAGLRNALLNSVNNNNVSSYSPSELNNLIKNSEDLIISFNNSKADYTMKLKREISVFPFSWSAVLSKYTAYINIMSFEKGFVNWLSEDIFRYKKNGIRNLVIDLRGVSFGSYKDVADFISLFSKKGNVAYYVKSSKKGYTETFFIDKEYNKFSDFNLFVLVDRNTVLLGEIAAQALRENSNAVIIGEKTSGEIYLTKLFRVGYKKAAQITIAKLYPPSGKDLDDGVIPDIQAVYRDYNKFKLTYVLDLDNALMAALKAAEMNFERGNLN